MNPVPVTLNPTHKKNCSLRKDLGECIENCGSRYATRGKPAAATAWSPRQMHWYCKWQLKSKVRKSQLGGFGWQLPEKRRSGQPAEMPPEVQDFIESEKLEANLI